MGDVASGLLPVVLGKRPRGLHRALDQQALAVSALRGAGNLNSAPDDIEAFGAGKALPGRFFAATGSEFGPDIEPCERVANPFMDPLVTLRRARCIPPVARRENQAVSPVRVMR